MKTLAFILGLTALTMTNTVVHGIQLRQKNQLQNAVKVDRLDETTKASVKRAAAAALKVAVAAKKAEAAESIKTDMREVHKAEKQETSDAINESIDRMAREEEKRAVERAVAHVERIR